MAMQSIVYIVNINQPSYSSYCINSWKKWCERHDAQLVTLTESLGDIEPHWGKVYPFELLENSDIDYDRILVVDNDTIVHPNCPNFFDIVPEDKIGVVFDDTNFDWTIRSTDAYFKHVFDGFDRFDAFEYFNSGFIVLSKQHKKVYDQILKFVHENYSQLNWVQENYGVGRDQTPLNFLLRKYGALQYMSKRFNCQGLISKEITDPHKLKEMVYISHYNAIPREHRGTLMGQVYKHLYE